MKKLFTLLYVVFASTFVSAQEANSGITHSLSINPAMQPFYHGVASGDPLTDRVIIWTRVTPDSGTTGAISVDWKIATDTNITQVVNSGTVSTDAGIDYTVKVDATGLSPNSVYYYQFTALGKTSVIGRTKTTPSGNTDSLRFAIVSCANFEAGFFNAYGAIKNRNDVDAVIMLGDYIYEYETGGYGLNTTANRTWEPATEILSLSDYRTRYAHYHLDEDLRKLHQQFPWVIIWDDHETANDSWEGGAENHDTGTEGDWFSRKDAGIEAHHEWLPIRTFPNDTHRIFRTLSYGNLVDLIMLDTRLEGRMAKVQGVTIPLVSWPVVDVNNTYLNDTSRKIMSDTQFDWFTASLSNSATKWKMIGNQVMVGPLRYKLPPFGPTYVLNVDQWDGFPAQRQRIFDHILSNNIQDVFFVTGDIHTSWANDLPYVTGTNYDPNTGAGSAAVEFVGTSVTSPGMPIPFPVSTIQGSNPNIKYADLTKKGFLIIDINTNRTQSDYYFTVTLDSANSTSNFETSWYVNDGERFLRQGTAASVARPSLTSVPFAPDEPSLTGIQEQANNNPMIFGIYPNPFSDFFVVQFYTSLKSANSRIRITDISGKTIMEEQPGIISAGLHLYPVEMRNLPEGIYFLLLETENGTATQKLVKTK